MTVAIEVTYDLVCPWCYLGLRRLQKAIVASARDDLHVVLWPYQLAREVPESGVDHFEFFAKRVGKDRVRGIYAQMESLARGEGVTIDYDRVKRLPNTRLGHELVVYAQSRRGENTGLGVATALMKAHFSSGLDIGDRATLLEIGASEGLEQTAVESYWSSEEATARLGESAARSNRLGISGVPHFVVDGRSFAGALPEAELLSLLTAA